MPENQHVKSDMNVEEFRKMISVGAVNAVSDEGEITILMVATQLGYLDIVRELVAKGADLEARDELGRTALLYAAHSGSLEMVEELLSCGADVGATDKAGNIATSYASGEWREAIARKLIDKDMSSVLHNLAEKEKAEKQQSDCFIASAVYSPHSEEVIALQLFRDRFLCKYIVGRAFVSTYYRVSPPVAKWIELFPVMKFFWKLLLKPFVIIASQVNNLSIARKK